MNTTHALAATLRRPGFLDRSWLSALRIGRRSPQLVLGCVIVAAFVFIGVFAPALAPFGYDEQNLSNQVKPPVWSGGVLQHPLGTDEFGRDTLSRLLYGARISLYVGIFGVLISALIGITLGVIGGYFGANIDAVIMRIADLQYSFPYVLLAIMITAFWGAGLTNVIVALGLAGWMSFARAARASTLSTKENEYVSAARAVGARPSRIMLRHILPNIMAPLLVFATFQVPARILAEATLSFLGLGIQPPTPSWGNMLSQSRGFLITQPWLITLPGVMLMIVALGVNQLGDGLRDILDPRMRRDRS